MQTTGQRRHRNASDKMIKQKKIIHSKLKVAFEVNLSSEGEMDANFVNNIYLLFFWVNNVV